MTQKFYVFTDAPHTQTRAFSFAFNHVFTWQEAY